MQAQRNKSYLYVSNLKRTRQLKGMSTRELGERTGMDQSMISKLENERRGAYPRTVRKIAEALDVSIEELVG